MSTIFLLLLSLFILSEQCAIDRSDENSIENVRDKVSIGTRDGILVYKYKEVPELPELGSDEKRELYYYEQTIAVRDSWKQENNNETIRCEIVEVYKEQEAADVLQKLTSRWNLVSQNVTMKDMMNLMNVCDALDDKDSRHDETDEKKFLEEWKKQEEEKQEASAVAKLSWFSIIVPGTKWCGPGDIADKYHDLDLLHHVDRCCRAHDLCPIKVLSKDERYELKNSAIYTKSNCICDEAFHHCLKKTSGVMAKVLGRMYFSIVSPDCIQGLPEFPDEKMKFIPARKW